MKREVLSNQLEAIMRGKYPERLLEYQTLLNKLSELNDEGKINSSNDIESFVDKRLSVAHEIPVIDDETGEVIEANNTKDSCVLKLTWIDFIVKRSKDLKTMTDVFNGIIQAVSTGNYDITLENDRADLILGSFIGDMKNNAIKYEQSRQAKSKGGKKSAEKRKAMKEGK